MANEKKDQVPEKTENKDFEVEEITSELEGVSGGLLNQDVGVGGCAGCDGCSHSGCQSCG